LLQDDEFQFLSAETCDNLPAEIATLQSELQAGTLRQLTAYERDPGEYWEGVQDRWGAIARAEWERFSDGATDDEPNGDTTIGAGIAAFLRLKLSEVETKTISPGRYESLRSHLKHFETFTNKHKPIASITSTLLLAYRTRLLEEIKRGTIQHASGKDRMASIRQFVKHLWRIELIDQLPRVMDDLTIRVPTKAVRLFDDDEITSLLATATGAGKLFILLSLNCGMLQKDIADLRQSEVDWIEGRITRKRSKTNHHEDVPIVCYQLWPETFELLKARRSRHPKLALTNRRGNPLKRESIVNGKLKVVCNISSTYDRLRRKLKITKPYKLLRKTSASKLASEYPSCRILFLGQSDTTIADKHYIKPDQGVFDRAVTWLGEQFGQSQSPGNGAG
jgi:integrase